MTKTIVNAGAQLLEIIFEKHKNLFVENSILHAGRNQSSFLITKSKLAYLKTQGRSQAKSLGDGGKF